MFQIFPVHLESGLWVIFFFESDGTHENHLERDFFFLKILWKLNVKFLFYFIK